MLKPISDYVPSVVSQAYLMGITEGRSLLIANPDMTPDDMRSLRDNCERCLRRGFGAEMRDMLRGERDFWANQIKKATA